MTTAPCRRISTLSTHASLHTIECNASAPFPSNSAAPASANNCSLSVHEYETPGWPGLNNPSTASSRNRKFGRRIRVNRGVVRLRSAYWTGLYVRHSIKLCDSQLYCIETMVVFLTVTPVTRLLDLQASLRVSLCKHRSASNAGATEFHQGMEYAWQPVWSLKESSC